MCLVELNKVDLSLQSRICRNFDIRRIVEVYISDNPLAVKLTWILDTCQRRVDAAISHRIAQIEMRLWKDENGECSFKNTAPMRRNPQNWQRAIHQEIDYGSIRQSFGVGVPCHAAIL